MESNIDENAIPTYAEISEQIDNNRPMLTIIASTPIPKGQKNNPAAQDGHWMLIIGYQQLNGKPGLILMDPESANGMPYDVPYDSAICAGFDPPQYWQNTSYVGPEMGSSY